MPPISTVLLRIVWSFFLFLTFQLSFAQSGPYPRPKGIPFSLAMYHHEGFFYKHRPSIANLPDALSQGIEINYRRYTFGENTWEQLYRYPAYGFTFVYINNGLPLLGHSFMAIPYFSLPLLRAQRHSFHFDIGIGASYVTQTYTQDTLNKLISNHVNYAAMVRLQYQFQLTPTLSVDAGLNFLHNSNGGSNRPNLGINTPTLHLGLQYKFNQEGKEYIRQDSIPKAEKKFIFSASYGLGYKAVEYKWQTYNTYFCHTVGLNLGFQVSRRSIPMIGIDWLYDPSLEARVGELQQSNFGGDYYTKSLLARNTRLGLLLGHELLVTPKFSMIGQFGFFVYDPYKVDGLLYQRLGIRYYFTKNIFAAWYLKTFYARADNWELTVGFRLK